jgi:hydroxyacylglutathione hydrolase
MILSEKELFNPNLNRMLVKQFTFNSFQENTYVLYQQQGDCLIIDPGCSDRDESQELFKFIQDEQLKPVRLLLTHAHIDHILGLAAVAVNYQLTPELHFLDMPLYESAGRIAQMYGLAYNPGPEKVLFLTEEDEISLGGQQLRIIHAPGHSPGSICFFNAEAKFIISGDVLFKGSIGRTDLPGGSMDELRNSITCKLYNLPEDTRVYSGHGPNTMIGHEKTSNPFVRL